MDVTPQQLSDEIMNLFANFKTGLSEVAEGCNLTKVQMIALYAIHSKGEIPMGQMAGILHCDPSNVTGIVDRLAGQELIVREESPKDRRTKIIRLTDKGRQFIDQAKAEIPGRLKCDQLSNVECRELCKLLRKLNALHPQENCPGQIKK